MNRVSYFLYSFPENEEQIKTFTEVLRDELEAGDLLLVGDLKDQLSNIKELVKVIEETIIPDFEEIKNK